MFLHKIGSPGDPLDKELLTPRTRHPQQKSFHVAAGAGLSE